MNVPTRGRHRVPLVLGALSLAAMLAAAGCAKGNGDNQVASVTGSGSAHPSASASPMSQQEKALKFAQCMRDHGVPMQDPQFDGSGGITIGIDGDKSSVDKTTLDAAQQACKEYQPGGGPNAGPPDPQMLENMRKMAQCMRDNGVPDFPDPDPNGGGIQINGSVGDDPDFQAAQEKCGKLYGPKGSSASPMSTQVQK